MADRRRPKPHHHVAERTKRRRPSHCLSQSAVRRAKQLRDEDYVDFSEIARRLGYPVEDVKIALSPTRSPNPESSAASIYTDKPVKQHFLRVAPPGRSQHERLALLLEDYEHLRRLLGR